MSVDIVLDIGTSKTLIYGRGRPLLERPSVVTVDFETFEPVYFGNDAKSTLGRTPEVLTAVKPIEHGIVSDYEKSKKFSVEQLELPILRENYREERGDWKLDLQAGDVDWKAVRAAFEAVGY